jgi:hypothetical protein
MPHENNALSRTFLGGPFDGSIAHIEIELRAVRSRRGNQFLV